MSTSNPQMNTSSRNVEGGGRFLIGREQLVPVGFWSSFRAGAQAGGEAER